MVVEIITIAIIGVGWLVTLTTLWTRLVSRVDVVEKQYRDCRNFRSEAENKISTSLEELKTSMGELNEKMAIVCTNVTWLEKEREEHDK